MRIKQRQVLPGVDKALAQATKVYVAEACAANDILVATGTKNGFLSVVKAANNDLTKCRGPFFVADFAAAVGDYVAVGLPWKLVTGANTSTAANVGDPVWLSTAGAVTFGSAPTPASANSGLERMLVVGRVVTVHASTGAYLLEPQKGEGGPFVGQTVGDGDAIATVTGFTGEFNNTPAIAQSGGDSDRHVIRTAIIAGTLTIEFNDTVDASDIVTYMVSI
tara:strand:- start:2763 stop:3425 length:663 start_codon:yes stop_codon:yes gene_type:complete